MYAVIKDLALVPFGLQVLQFDWEPGTRSMGHLDVGGTAGTTTRWLPVGWPFGG